MSNLRPDSVIHKIKLLAPKLVEVTDEILFGDIWKRPGLSPRDRSMVTVAALIALQRTEQLRSHMGRAKLNGVTREQVGEVITHLAFYSGWPTAITAAQVALEIWPDGDSSATA